MMTCAVCGKELAKNRHSHVPVPHAECLHDIGRWMDMAKRIEQDEALRAANDAVAAAEAERDRIYGEHMRRANIPDWIAKQVIEGQYAE